MQLDTPSPSLMEHQLEGVEFLLRAKCGLLAFEQGLGKTLVAIVAFSRLLGNKSADRMVVLCPNTLKRNWAAELERWAPNLETVVIGGIARDRRDLLALSKAQVVIVNYESARNEIASICAILRRQRCVLLLDESHNVKNLRSINCIAAQHFGPLAEYRWLLSGTPVTNKPLDIYSQIDVIDPRHSLGPPEAFELKFADAERDSSSRQALNRLLQRYVLRKTKDECLDLPDKLFADVILDLPDWQRTLYDDIRDGLLEEVGGMSDAAYKRFMSGTALTRLLRLSQVASNPALVFEHEVREPAKFAALDRLLDDLASKGKIIIWSSYVKTIETLVERYSHFGATAIYGAVPAELRQDVTSAFQSDGGPRILIANPAAAGTGLTLTAAQFAIYESLTWRYDLYAQSQDRNHRIGQARDVKYIRLIAKNTIEEKIVSELRRKDEMAQEIMSGSFSTQRITRMSREELRVFLKGPSGS